jgi:antitoxin VapB
MQSRRAQKPITIRSDRAYERLRVLTRDGRSQAQLVEEALDRLAETTVPVDDLTERMARIRRIQADFARTPSITMAEFDAREYDADGNPR